MDTFTEPSSLDQKVISDPLSLQREPLPMYSPLSIPSIHTMVLNPNHRQYPHSPPLQSPNTRPPTPHRFNLPLRPAHSAKPLRQLTPIKEQPLPRLHLPQLVPRMPAYLSIRDRNPLYVIRRWCGRGTRVTSQGTVLLGFGAVGGERVGEGGGGGCGVDMGG